ncbi:alpha/beta hydrolase [Rhodococcus koreensis]
MLDPFLRQRVDPELRPLVDSAADRPPLSATSIIAARAAVAGASSAFDPGPSHIETEDLLVPTPMGAVPARLYRPADPMGLLLWFHGGSWAVGGLDPSDRTMRHLAEESGFDVVHVDYRLAPEHRFPAAADDACAAIRWAIQDAGAVGIETSTVAVGGDSAGGNLAAVAALYARNENLPLDLQVLVYPAVDATLSASSLDEFAEGFLISSADVRWSWSHYGLGELAAPDDWRISPISADPTGVAPALIISAELDPTVGDSIAYAEHLRAAGVPVEYTCYPGTVHTFFNLRGVSTAARKAHEQIGDAVRMAAARS